MSRSEQPSLLILNQMAGPMTWELAEDLGDSMGCVALFTGHADTLQKQHPTVRLFRAAAYSRDSFTRRTSSWVWYWLQAFFWLWRWPRHTPLLLFSNPPILVWLGWLMSRLRNHAYVVMVHDIYPDTLIGKGVLPSVHPIVYAWRWLNQRSYESANLVMTLGELMAKNLERQFDPAQSLAGEIKVIYPWADTQKIRPVPKQENWFSLKYNQTRRMTVMYSGNMGLGHDIETMLAVARELREEPEIHFVFVGAGPKWFLVEEALKTEELPNVTLLGWQPESVLPFSLATADVALVSLDMGLEGLAVPSKTVYAMAAGGAIIVLANKESELCRWVEEGGCGIVVSPGDEHALKRALYHLLTEPDLLRTMQMRGRLFAEQRYDRRANTRRISLLIQSFCGASPPL